MKLANIDLGWLRTLVVTQELGGFGRAAGPLGRTPSAISLQMKRLQDEVGVPLFRHEGRRTLLTEQGEIAVRYARRLLELNDEMVDTLRGASLTGAVRIGFAQDFVDAVLPLALARFNSLYPLVRLEVKVERNAWLESEIEAGRLDVALTLGNPKRPTGKKIGELPLAWIAGPGFKAKEDEPLPLALFEEPCVFRRHATDALDGVGRSWRVAMTSPSVAGLWAAVGAGLGVTVRARVGAPAALDVTPAGLPPMGTIGVTLHRRTSAGSSYVRRLAEIVGEVATAHYGLQGSAAGQLRG